MVLVNTLVASRALVVPDTTIMVKAIAGMQYDKVRLKVKPGTQVKLVLSNEDDMSHNLVVTQSESRVKVVEAGMALAEKGPEMDFIPAIPEVLWSIPVVAPGEEKFVVFTAPSEESILPFVCTYPGHGYIMYGAIYVQLSDLPPLHNDTNIPEFRRNNQKASAGNTDHIHTQPHPYNLDPPYYYRIFMPDATPASIAIRLSDNVSCCWDAGPCNLLYAWNGGFIDNSVAWKGHKNTESKILGEIFYKNHDTQLLRFGDASNITNKIEFKGYTLEEGFPVFKYSVDGYVVNEKITVGGNKDELIREFSIENLDTDIWIPYDPNVMVSSGARKNGYIQIPSSEGSRFSLTIKN